MPNDMAAARDARMKKRAMRANRLKAMKEGRAASKAAGHDAKGTDKPATGTPAAKIKKTKDVK